MNWMISKRDPLYDPKSSIGVQQCGIIFWQKTGFLRRCNLNGFTALMSLAAKNFAPTDVFMQEPQTCYLTFNGCAKNVIFIQLKSDKNGHFYIYGEAHTAYANRKFHLFALDVVEFIARNTGCRFYVDDATGYIGQRSVAQLDKYISEYQNAHAHLIRPTFK